MDSRLKKDLPSVNSRSVMKGLVLAVLVYSLFLTVSIIADESARLWNSNVISALIALVLTSVTITQLLIIFYIYSLSKKTSQMAREFENLRITNSNFQSEYLSASEENLISIEALRSVLHALNAQRMDS